MKSDIVHMPRMLLAGFNFFGDPFRSHSGWHEENEIGRLWARWMAYVAQDTLQTWPIPHGDMMYELHVYHAETLQTGEFEIVAGVEVSSIAGLPPEVVVKCLPATRYAVFTLVGQEITSDWTWALDHEWLPALGVERLTTFSLQRYDARFKGMDAIADSALDVYIPLVS